MRTFIIGSKELSCIILDTLIGAGHEVVGVYSRDTEPGMLVWRNMGHRSLAQEAEEMNVPVHHNMKVNSEASINLLTSLNLDVVYSCFWSEIFKQPILDIPKLGVFNFHSALLPNYRGSRPIPWAIINGEERTGMTAHKMLPGIDNGPIAGSISIEIGSNNSAKEAYDRVISNCPGLVLSVTSKFNDGSAKLIEQNEQDASYYPRGEPFGRQLNAWWSDAQQKRFERAFDFPPFEQARSAPGPINSDKGPQVYIVTSEDIPTMEISKFAFDLKQNSIGTPMERKELKSHLPPQNTQGVKLDENGAGMFMIHDVLIGNRIEFITSAQISIEDIKTSWAQSQPHRHENGLLEIPMITLENKDALLDLLNEAKLQAKLLDIDIFIHLEMTEETAQLARSQDLTLIQINTIANHFNSE
jgi:methionyl-tRNA formyltransferase